MSIEEKIKEQIKDNNIERFRSNNLFELNFYRHLNYSLFHYITFVCGVK